MSDINTSTMLQVGIVLHGTYRIESYLSSGGFGNTYIAKNIEFGETCAVKEFFVKGVCQRDNDSTTISVSNSENTDSFAQQKEKFKKEARRLRSLNNPHIVKVYDLFEENGTAYYVMDYVDGESLSTRLNRTHTPLAESVVRNYLSQILDGLDAIHAAGIWHLDIKPANIMVDRHDVVKLIDFGASKQQSAAGGATASTGISYTNGYAPSEQMAQSFDKFGPWTDFYALGATLYKLLTNQNPPSVTDLSEDESEDKHIALPMPNVSTEMKKLVVWMMLVNRLKRPKNVGEIKNYLENVNPLIVENVSATNTSSQSTNQPTVDKEETVLLEKGKEEQTNEETDEDNPKGIRSTLTFVLVLVAVCCIFFARSCNNRTAPANMDFGADSDTVVTIDKNSESAYAENNNSIKKNMAYVVKDNPTDNFYKIRNAPIIEDYTYYWGLTGLVVSKECTILHKWCTPNTDADTYIWSTVEEFIEDAQTKQKFYIYKSDIGIGDNNGVKVKGRKQFMFAEWYQPLPSSVTVINIYNGNRYIVENLHIK